MYKSLDAIVTSSRYFLSLARWDGDEVIQWMIHIDALRKPDLNRFQSILNVVFDIGEVLDLKINHSMVNINLHGDFSEVLTGDNLKFLNQYEI